MKYILSFIVLTTTLISFYGQSEILDPKLIISEKMEQQENSWNNGDINEFMMHYWESDSLSFVGKSGLKIGWQTTLDNYLRSYPNTEEMGKLEFLNIYIKQIDINTVHVIGKWKLIRDESIGNLEGHYSLIWQQKNEKWVIIADHSS